jgi:aryl-alcohol dehydrogenase-like predicted oxidoreductase
MHTRKVGPFDVSAIGLGCMNCSAGYGPGDDKTSARLLNRALDAGYQFLDTASMYGDGHNETLIGKSLRDRRNEYILASKCGLIINEQGQRIPDGRPDTLKRQCDESLKRLKTDCIDLYYLHRMDKNVAIEESVGALAELIAQGKIRSIGLSEVSSATLRRAHAVHPIAALQSEYSLWSRTPEAGILNVCEELDVSFVAFSPLGRGFLSGKAQDVTHLTADDIRCNIARPRFEVDNFAQNSKLLIPFGAIAEKNHCSMAQLAIAWLLAQQNSAGEKTIVPIPGTKHIDYMLENAAADPVELDAETIQQLDTLINEQTVIGSRYNESLMQSIDSERDNAG